MSIKSSVRAVFSLPSGDVIGRLETKLQVAHAALRAAQETLAEAVIEAEGSATPGNRDGVQKARAALSAAKEQCAELDAALTEARQRKASADAAEKAEREEKEAKAYAARRAKLMADAATAARRVESIIGELAEAARDGIEAQVALAPYYEPSDFATQIATAKLALSECVRFNLKFLPGMVTAILDGGRADWSRYVPSVVLTSTK